MSRGLHPKKFHLNFSSLSFVILIHLWFIITPLVFFYLRKLYLDISFETHNNMTKLLWGERTLLYMSGFMKMVLKNSTPNIDFTELLKMGKK